MALAEPQQKTDTQGCTWKPQGKIADFNLRFSDILCETKYTYLK